MKTQLVGILNITPDSFSDGGAYDALKQAQMLLESGAKVLDVGAESTRPDATPITPAIEIERLNILPAIITHAKTHGAVVSLDTRHAEAAEFGLTHGVAWINDVGGATNQALLEVVAGASAKYVLMHSLGVPANPSVTLANDEHLLPEITAFFKQKIEYLAKIGIAKERIIIDAGLGFGKCAHGSVRLMLASAQIQHEIGCPLLVGHSRKSMLKAFGAEDMAQRNALTLLASAFLAEQKIAYLRVHDVAAHRDILATTI